MHSEVELMTDEQFETYNKLLQLVDELISELPSKNKKIISSKKKTFY